MRAKAAVRGRKKAVAVIQERDDGNWTWIITEEIVRCCWFWVSFAGGNNRICWKIKCEMREREDSGIGLSTRWRKLPSTEMEKMTR